MPCTRHETETFFENAKDTLSLPQAIRLVERDIVRNEVAQASHEKSWREKHKDVELLPL